MHWQPFHCTSTATSPSNTLLPWLFVISVAFMTVVNHWRTILAHCDLLTVDQTALSSDYELALHKHVTVLAHCDLITADQIRTNSTFIRPQANVTQAWPSFQTWGKTLPWRHAIADSGFCLSDRNFGRRIQNPQISLLMPCFQYGV